MDRLPVIPTPPGQLWRECRIRFVPIVCFLTALGVAAMLWHQNTAVANLVGEVESVHANVSSPKAGKLVLLNVTRLQRVRAGDTIAQVITTDPEILKSSLAVIQAEIQLVRVNLEPVLGQQRYSLTLDRLRLDWMDQRVQLATARVRLQLADSELKRTQELYDQKVQSRQVLEEAMSNKQSLEAEVNERATLVDEQERRLKQLSMSDGVSTNSSKYSPDHVLRASIKVQEEKLRLTEVELSPVTLTVPIDGIVTAIHHRSGEAVLAGAPIVTLTSSSTDRIVSYLRQPFPFEPKVGMAVEVRTRSSRRCVSHAEILEVGAQMEPISAALTVAHGGNNLQEVGLPVMVSVPAAHKLIPGELVDLRIIPELKAPVSLSGEVR